MRRIAMSRVSVFFLTAAMLGAANVGAVPPANDFSYGGNNGYEIPRYQPPHPTVSPYVALTGRTGLGSAGTYYSIVRPQITQRALNNSQSITLERIERQQTQLRRQGQESRPSTTGHSAGYMTQSRYFGTTNAAR